MLKIVCNRCQKLIESFSCLNYGLAEYLEKTYAGKDENLCNKCWIAKHQAAERCKKALVSANKERAKRLKK